MNSNKWAQALANYCYRVDIRVSTHEVPPCPSLIIKEKGDREATIALEDWFRANCEHSLEPWLVVAYWKNGSQGGRARKVVDGLRKHFSEVATQPSQLFDGMIAFVESQSKSTFVTFRNLLFPRSRSLATAWTFVSFYRPMQFPMVDTRIAKWVLRNKRAIESKSGQVVLPKYPDNGSTVLTLSDFQFVEWWSTWCRNQAKYLSANSRLDWRARDVEMAVYSDPANSMADELRG